MLRRPRLDRYAAFVIGGIAAVLTAIPALVTVPLWLIRWYRGTTQPWLPLLVPAAVGVLVITAELWTMWRRSRERIVVDQERRTVELRRVILGGRGLLFGSATTRVLPFAAIVAVESTHHGHSAPGAKLVISERMGVMEEIEVGDEIFDRGNLSTILKGQLQEEWGRRGEVWA